MVLGDLRNYLVTPSPDQFTWDQKYKCIMNIVRGLIYLHTYKVPIIHRDLKSRYVLMDTNNGTKVTDFGTSRVADGECRLAQAAAEGDKESVLALLAKGVSPNATKYAYSALYNACWSNSSDIIDLLLAAGADVNYGGWSNEAPLNVAIGKGHVNIVKKLLDANASIAYNGVGLPPIISAVATQNCKMLESLLETKADVNLYDERHNLSPLFLAASLGNTEIVQVLLNAKANVNQTCGYACKSPLLAAAAGGCTEIVNMLLRQNADVNLSTKDGMSPIYVASFYGHTEIVKTLIHANANVDKVDQNGETALFQAVLNGHSDIVELLLAAGADYHLNNKKGVSLLSTAVKAGHESIIARLLAEDISIDISKNGPLAIAVESGNQDIILMICLEIAARARAEVTIDDEDSDYSESDGSWTSSQEEI
ncbi:ankyrin-1-like [Thraustotheca clavata]|uniref:Ankyrin-1-like n=1 Tax=Thraustotheca clavata TaxID=74557 RepID=A0A1V9ZCY2_9STRA|nr:ankyrin-1-like [Thraustotheca clavata]